MAIHKPVLLKEMLQYLQPCPGQVFIDCTYGAGGHSKAILKKVGNKGKVIGIDWDKTNTKNTKTIRQPAEHKNILLIVHNNYKNLKQIANDTAVNKVNGILLDLGFCSDQLNQNRGFSFKDEGLFDLRYDQKSDRPTAAEILKTYSENELAAILSEYGEEPLARQIAKKIIANRRQGKSVETAAMLVQLITDIYRRKFKSRSKFNPATRAFQALRIAVNDEYGNLRKALPQAIDLLIYGGRLVVISFHSGEDRIVKNFFRDQSKKEKSGIKILTKKPIVPTAQEIKDNPRARSAKMRVIEKI